MAQNRRQTGWPNGLRRGIAPLGGVGQSQRLRKEPRGLCPDLALLAARRPGTWGRRTLLRPEGVGERPRSVPRDRPPRGPRRIRTDQSLGAGPRRTPRRKIRLRPPARLEPATAEAQLVESRRPQ